MANLDSHTSTMLAVVVVLVLVALAAWYFIQKRQSERLQQRFGPEYGRTVDELGSRTKAEAELKAREDRVGKLTIVPLAPSEASRFSQAWANVQASFVDNPKGVVAMADQLVRELMAKRGYPVADFEHRAADISVDHPAVVENYRAAQVIAARDARGEATTEDLRNAVVHYRVLFNELLEVSDAAQGKH
ncbi:hypothetical protein AB595_16270 [Massilia sp. WF1]|uniref:hypothetical protein n=1 Tax=unclassified Massilia TaxID=2609279 RepID=UPI0006497EDB|nr:MULTISPECIES: hypothetical protein [unclassified Massilia]ALK97845.1 hypothetical protein AM586_18170 [Massilia sp. WG5]KLU35809.1 hypothetical protein AB595_16270 [Massilia sp. WF1]